MAHQKSYVPSAPFPSVHGDAFELRSRDDTENDELRGVIDDLTVENKKLKQLLKAQQTFRSSRNSGGPDKVFEVRMNGLPAEKKRELEQVLKGFATALSIDSLSHPRSSAAVGKSPPSAENATFAGPKIPQDLTNTDSGYATVSNTGLNSISGSGRAHDVVFRNLLDKDIKNYLHDIPDSLLPKETASLSERDKMALAVERLEHLFTGKTAKSGEHSQPAQQQKISQSAAKADRLEDRKQNRAVKVEGSREARIRPPDPKIDLDAFEQEPQAPSQRQDDQSWSSSSETTRTHLDQSRSPAQRPTRPLDLDINRAQIAADNVRYIQHLHLDPALPQDEAGVTNSGQPWIYLNLLISLAQLHTLNVTPSLIRKAIKVFSTKFEFSEDGQKVLWTGSTTQDISPSTQESQESAAARLSPGNSEDGAHQGKGTSSSGGLDEPSSTSLSNDKATREMPSTTTSTTINSVIPPKPGAARPLSKYKPIVYQGENATAETSDSYLDSSSSNGELSGYSNGLGLARSRSNLRYQNEWPEGYLTFFSNPYFCADLSGDKAPISLTSTHAGSERSILGVGRSLRPDDDVWEATSQSLSYISGAEMTPQLPNHPDIEMELSPMKEAGEYETQPMELPASGIGGVRPEDNFALDVKIARLKVETSTKTGKEKRMAEYSYRTEGCEKLDLQPSRLPPPSYYVFTPSSSSSSGRQDLNDESSDESSGHDDLPVPAGFRWHWSSSSNERQMVEEEQSEVSSDFAVLETV